MKSGEGGGAGPAPWGPSGNGQSAQGLNAQDSEPSTQHQEELITCELCNLSKQEKGGRENSSCGNHSSSHNRLVPLRSQREEGKRTLVMPKATAPPFPWGSPKSPSSPVLGAGILTRLTAFLHPGDRWSLRSSDSKIKAQRGGGPLLSMS